MQKKTKITEWVREEYLFCIYQNFQCQQYMKPWSFFQITDSLDLYFLRNYAENILTRLTILCQNSKLILELKKSKKHFKVKTTFSSRPRSKGEIVVIIKCLQNNKTSGGEIILNILKKSNFTFYEMIMMMMMKNCFCGMVDRRKTFLF